MAKFMEEVDGSGGLSRTKHALRSVLTGDIESGRLRLTRALERLGYSVISEDPLYARRGARGWAVYYCSLDILDYPRELKIGLKALSPSTTLATFDYAVDHFGALGTKGDRQTLRLEAEAIIALATQNATITVCRACGTNQPDDSRFCRVCGAPNVGGEPAELELLRVTALARGGHHLITAAVIWAIAPLITVLVAIMYLGASGRFTLPLLLAQVANLIILFVVLKHSRKTVNPKLSQPQTSRVNLAEAEVPIEAAQLFVPAASFSEPKYITEGTTELLTPTRKEREKELVSRRGRDTSPTG